MKLNEMLEKLVAEEKITSDQMESITSSVNTIRDSAVAKVRTELTNLQTKYDSLSDELRPYQEKEKQDRIRKLIPENVNPDHIDDFITLSGLSDEDSDEDISKKFSARVEKSPYFLKQEVVEPEPKEEKTEEPPKKKVDPVVSKVIEKHKPKPKMVKKKDKPIPSFIANL